MITLGVAVALVVSGALGLLSLKTVRSGTLARRISTLLMLASVFFQLASCLSAYFHREILQSDWGVFAVQVLTPILILISSQRIIILRYASRVAVLFAFGDLFVNSVTFLGLASVAKTSGNHITSYGIHYLGLTGNSFAEGFVAFLAISYIASGLPCVNRRSEYTARCALIGLLFFSEFLIRARLDLGISIIAVALLSIRSSSRIPMISVSIIISTILLFAVLFYNPYDTDETLRANLMKHGLAESSRNLILGEGSRYRPTSALTADFHTLDVAGITESGTIDYTISYGLPSIVLLYLSVFFALGASRNRQTLTAVLLACLTGALALNGGLASFLGTIIFYTSLIICQKEEWWLMHNIRLPIERLAY